MKIYRRSGNFGHFQFISGNITPLIIYAQIKYLSFRKIIISCLYLEVISFVLAR